MNIKSLFFPLAVSGLVFLSSCHKKETVQVDNETQSVIDNAVAEQEFMAIAPTVNSHAINTKGTGAQTGRTFAAPCDTLTKISGDTLWSSPTHVAPVYTLALSRPGCNPFPDTKFREGYLWIQLFGKVRTPGSKIKVALNGYKAYFDAAKKITYAADTVIITTQINDSINGIRQFNIQINNGKCTGNGWNTTYYVNRTIRHETMGDTDKSNDIIKVWGTSGGVNREGRKFDVNVPQNTPLVKHSNCEFISAGTLELTPDGFKTRTVDYTEGTGNDVCNDVATFSVNGNTISFKLK